MPMIFDITPASSTGGLPIPHYTGITAKKLGRVLRTAAANLAGSEATISMRDLTTLPVLFAADNSRFMSFHNDPSNYPSAVAMEVGASTFTLGTASNIRAVAGSMFAVRQSPANPLQAASIDQNEYVSLSTLGATGTTFTHSNHNLNGSVAGATGFADYNVDIVWATDGGAFVVVFKNTSTSKMNFALYTVSGTTLTYVGVTAGSNNINTITKVLAELTGGDSNEAVVSVPCTATAGFLFRITFDTSAVTIAMEKSDADAVIAAIGQAKPFAYGEIHNYPISTTAKKVFDGSGTGEVSGNLGTVQGVYEYSAYSNAPFGPNMNWDIGVDSNEMYPALQGLGVSPLGRGSLNTLSSEDAKGFCASHDLSKAVSIHKAGAGGTYTYRGYNCPT